MKSGMKHPVVGAGSSSGDLFRCSADHRIDSITDDDPLEKRIEDAVG